MRFSVSLETGKSKRSDPLENPSISLSDPRAFVSIFGGGPSSSGVVVTEQVALSVPALWSAVNFISGTIAALPLQLFGKDKQGNLVKADKNPLYRIVHDVVNENFMTSFDWRKHGMLQCLLKGRWLTFIERNAAGRVMNLWPLQREKVRIEVKNGRTRYLYTPQGGKEVIYDASEVIDVAWMLSSDGVTEIAPLDSLRDAVGLARALEDYAAKFFQNGGIPPLVMEAPAMSPGAAARAGQDVQDSLKRASDEQRNILVMPTGHTLKPVGVKPEESQMMEARAFQVLEIARIYNLPPVFLQDLSHGTFSNTEQQDLNFVKHTLTQWLEAIEQQMNAKLFANSNGGRNYVEFNVDGLLRGDFASRMSGYSTGIQNGVIKPNEARAMENRPPAEGGDQLYIQGGTVPITQSGQDGNATPPVDNPVTDPDENPVQEGE